MGREENIAVFKDTVEWYRHSKKLSEAVSDSIDSTRLYDIDEIPELPEKRYENTKITVTGSRSFAAACELRRTYPDLRIGVHNFASAVHPGGGVASGCTAQEESLCRCSTLYPVLDTGYLRERYYSFNRERHDYANTDAVIYTPDILIIKSDTAIPRRLEAEKWVKVDVLTVAAPDLRGHLDSNICNISNDELYRLHIDRAKKMLAVAADKHIDVLVLGAFGCGAFQNDPVIVAKAYREILPEFNGYFKEIEFAIYCTGVSTPNYDAFSEALKDLPDTTIKPYK